MLYGNDAIFGVVDFSGQLKKVQREVDRIVFRARRLGARNGYQTFGPAVLGWVDRRFTNGQGHDSTVPVSLAGEIFAVSTDDSAVLSRDKKCQWLVDDYKLRGSELLACLDGTFALAIWQQDKELLTLMTDRCGDTRLYYRVDENGFAFSSWLNLLSSADSQVNRQAVHEFLRFLYITPPQTIYAGVRAIEPGHFVTVSRGMIESHEIEPPGRTDKVNNTTEIGATTLAKFGEIFETSIQRRISGRRVGVFLSSGVDSATLLAGCQRAHPAGVEAFTVGFADVEMDETNAARAYANTLGVPHHALRLGLEDYRVAFRKMVHELDQPFGDPATLPLICAAGVAKERVDVLTDGSGSDGLFGTAIPRHLRFSIECSARLPVAARKWIGKRLRGLNGIGSNSMLFDFDDPEELFITWSGWRKCELEELTGASVSFADSGFYRAFRGQGRTSAQDRFEAIGIFPPDDARFGAATISNIPIELPYHDIALRAYVRGLPQSLRFRDGDTKILLKQLFAKYYSCQIDCVKKRYFTFPLQSFMAAGDYALARRYLSAESLGRHGLVDPERVRPWIDRYLAGDQSLQFKIWSLLVIHGWAESRY